MFSQMTVVDDEKKVKEIQEDNKYKILLEKFRIAAEIQDNYNKLFWDRTNVFFVIIAALFASYGLIATKILEEGKPRIGTSEELVFVLVPFSLVLVFFGVFGALLSRLWLIMHRRATKHQNTWRKKAQEVEKKINLEPTIIDESRIADDEESEYESGFVRILFLLFRIPHKSYKEKNNHGRSESLRKTLDRVLLAFILIWIGLGSLGIWILLLLIL